MLVGDPCKVRDDFRIARERMNIDRAAAVRERRQAGAANEIRHAGLGEHVGQSLLGHALRLDLEKPVEQPRDLGIGARDEIAIAG